MKTYLVGGFVRDKLLGLDPKDKDYVVVGATPQQMLDNGFKQVGASFPVFLKNGEEYALARQERKVGVGYHGFEVDYQPTVTLEQDLIRRDLTINSMAMDIETGQIIDPYGGQQDLRDGILRHTSDAFSEDPVRVLRTARFAARYGFVVDHDTRQLMRQVASELVHVPQERIWAEFEKGLMEQHPHLMISALLRCDAFSYLLPYRAAPSYVDGLMRCVQKKLPLLNRFLMVCGAFTDHDFDRCCIPTELSAVGKVYNRVSDTLQQYRTFDAETRLKLLLSMDCIRRPHIFDTIGYTLCLIEGLDTVYPYAYNSIVQASMDAQSIRAIDGGAIAAQCDNPSQIKDRLHQARLDAIQW